MKTAAATKLDERAIDLRRRILDVLAASRRGHVGSAYSLVEIVRVLYDDILRFDANNPRWPDRDRFILSKGHGCLALYVMLADKGFFPQEELARFCSFDGILGGHPEAMKVPGVEASTGSLGHGPAFGLGMALAARMRGSEARVFVVTGDGECNEGSVWEAALAAGKHGLENFALLVDYNKMQSNGPTDAVLPLDPLAEKWRAFGFGADDVDGHDVDALRARLTNLPIEPGKPSAIVCHTIKGRGMPFIEQNPKWHHKSRMSDEELSQLYAELESN
jgi:transketolase